MKVILIKNVPKLGQQWEIREVADGYARNILLPRKLAVAATKSTLEQARQAQEEIAKKAERSLKRTQDLASTLDDYEIVLAVRTNEHGDLYAAITPKQISDALAQQGYRVSAKAVKIGQPIKRIGEHEVVLALDHGLEVNIKLIVEELSNLES